MEQCNKQILNEVGKLKIYSVTVVSYGSQETTGYRKPR